MYAHRGYTEQRHSENTFAALEHARRHRARAVEVDMRVTRDDRIVLMHDETLNRTTTCAGPVRGVTAASIRARCRAKGGPGAGADAQGDPRVGRAAPMRLILEVKVNAEKNAWTPALFVTLARMIDRARAAATRSSCTPSAPARCGWPRRPTRPCTSRLITLRWADVARARTWADGVNVWARHLNVKRVAKLHEEGLYVLGRESDDPADWRRIRRSGADGVVTDAVREALRRHPRAAVSASG